MGLKRSYIWDHPDSHAARRGLALERDHPDVGVELVQVGDDFCRQCSPRPVAPALWTAYLRTSASGRPAIPDQLRLFLHRECDSPEQANYRAHMLMPDSIYGRFFVAR